MAVFTDRQGTDRQECERAEVEEAAQVLLQHSPYRALRHLTCRFDGTTLTLEGRVATYHYKQLAQTVVAEIDAISRVVNEVEVASN